MIGHIQGEVLFSDGGETIILTNSGVGYQVYFSKVLAEGHHISLYISHVIKEANQELFGFKTLREKKLFELLTTVKGIGPKSAYALMGALSPKEICDAITFENKKALTAAPGVGPKAAAQVVLDLSGKIHKVMMVSDNYKVDRIISMPKESISLIDMDSAEASADSPQYNENEIIQDTIMACKELGFKEEVIIPLAHKVMGLNDITKAEQLVHLVLKEM
ncbi:MAG: Holliday junction branch migration protein RuvA [Bacteriovoracaceae bacterium]|nr:Holliday junction branch migration protein RuvA [Bacteriovoracaceae bacterium]